MGKLTTEKQLQDAREQKIRLKKSWQQTGEAMGEVFNQIQFAKNVINPLVPKRNSIASGGFDFADHNNNKAFNDSQQAFGTRDASLQNLESSMHATFMSHDGEHTWTTN